MKEGCEGGQPPQTNVDIENYLKSNQKTCIRCSVNGVVRKYSFVVFNQFKVMLCFPCIEALGGAAQAAQWIESNVNFPKNLIRFKRIQKIISHTHTQHAEQAGGNDV